VLDRLELADRPAELVPDRGVLRGCPDRPAGHAARFRSEEGGGQAGDLGAGQAGQDPPGGHRDLVGADGGQRAGRVQAVQPGDGQVRGVDHGPQLLRPGRRRQYHEVSQAAAEHRGGLAVEDQAAVGGRASQARSQRDGRGPRPVRQPGQQFARVAARAAGAGRGQQRARQHRRQEPARDQGVPQLLDGHSQLAEAVALAAVVLRQVQAE